MTLSSAASMVVTSFLVLSTLPGAVHCLKFTSAQEAEADEDLMLTPSSLKNCQMVTSSMDVKLDNVVFATPSLIVVEEALQNAGANHINRYLSFRLPDGSCREEGGMTLSCAAGAETTDNHCEEYGKSVKAGPCYSRAPGKCSFIEPPSWIRGELVAGLLGGGGDIRHSSFLQKGAVRNDLKILSLGVGAGAIPGFVSAHFPGATVTGVDIDADVLFAAKHFFLQADQGEPQGNVQLVNGDARVKLGEQQDGSLDAIYIDAYQPQDEAPDGLYTATQLRTAKSKLRAGGRLVMVVGIDDNAVPRKNLLETLKKLGFSEVRHGESHRGDEFVMGQNGNSVNEITADTQDTMKTVRQWYDDLKWTTQVD
mmetsp:Transcript_37617/g.69458  ORF Transcript_37617/g.69458 Transcript_37617/m.69458 type:complete len:367 (+) Transcript_37617:73-1173(+)